MSEVQTIIDNCTECNLCVNECDFLSNSAITPKKIAEHSQRNCYSDDLNFPYSCNLCGLCEVTCPQGLNVGKMVFEIRKEMVREGLAPLPCHKPIQESQQFYISKEFKAALPASDGNPTNSVFFPGCALSAYSPDLVVSTYKHIIKYLPDTGILLGCCGGPLYLLGDVDNAGLISQEISGDLKRLGAVQIIAACPYCLKLLRETHPEMNPVSLYTILEKIGIPRHKSSNQKKLTIHDPCSTRDMPAVQNSARLLLEKCGHKFTETNHSRKTTYCCGMGGMVYASDASTGAAKTRRIIKEADSEIVTYCATCRETIAGQGGHIAHLLDFIFNPKWNTAGRALPQDPTSASENLKNLKEILVSLSKSKKSTEKPANYDNTQKIGAHKEGGN
ncbi:MAG: (Fe-S)-binding protein [Methanomicrobium sp.]|nr:(Fe-S)-binding protein [Methanomicrobium sp.]